MQGALKKKRGIFVLLLMLCVSQTLGCSVKNKESKSMEELADIAIDTNLNTEESNVAEEEVISTPSNDFTYYSINELGSEAVQSVQMNYGLTGDEIILTKYIGTSDYVVVPDTIDGKLVIGIDSYAFSPLTEYQTKDRAFWRDDIGLDLGEVYDSFDNSDITFNILDVFLSYGELLYSGDKNKTTSYDTIMHFLEDHEKLSSITKVILPKNMKIISEYAFFLCDSLESIEYSGDELYIDDAAFAFCTSLNAFPYVYIGGEHMMADLRFAGCISLEEMTVTDKIGGGEFAGCKSLKQLTITDIYSPNMLAFYGCESLNDISFLGTEKQWSKIQESTKDGNEPLFSANVQCLSLLTEKREISDIWEIGSTYSGYADNGEFVEFMLVTMTKQGNSYELIFDWYDSNGRGSDKVFLFDENGESGIYEVDETHVYAMQQNEDGIITVTSENEDDLGIVGTYHNTN